MTTYPADYWAWEIHEGADFRIAPLVQLESPCMRTVERMQRDRFPDGLRIVRLAVVQELPSIDPLHPVTCSDWVCRQEAKKAAQTR